MVLYLTIFHLNSVIGKVELTQKFEIRQQSKPISYHAIIQGNKIFLPYFNDIAYSIGSPHATIEPISETAARYTQIFKTNKTEGFIDEIKTRWLFFRETKSKRISINKGEFLDLCHKSKGITRFVSISGIFSVWVSEKLF